MTKHFLPSYVLMFVFLFTFSVSSFAQNGFVRASGKQILDGDGNNLIFRGVGTGNWMIQEGYMIGSAGVAGTQWEFRKKLIETIGEARTDEFYQAWWDNHFTKADVDSMAKWGFNNVRVAMHYKMFTLPIEEEPVKGQNTWLEEGFIRIDNLLDWCASNKMYLILDMHGAPGGQGTDSNISDYDPSKPSLWESEENKNKLIALWRKLAERYADSPWIGGYDLINEPNWTLSNNNYDLWDLHKRLTVAVREVDKNHLLFLNGNWWSNDYSGLPELWDDNMALSFHKYWNHNEEDALDWIIAYRDQYNCPVWLGETGENSNTWFTQLVALCEKNNIGWDWWPVKKTGVNNIIQSKYNSDYNTMLNAWSRGSSINAETAYKGVMQFAEDHKIQNCEIKYDVIDALITRPYTDEVRPFKKYTTGDIIYAVDYDFGPVGKAYFDYTDVDNHLSYPDEPSTWNEGWVYRNDGVDIEACSDTPTNGYSVGWIEDGEWTHYTIQSPEEKAYTLEIRYASQSEEDRVYLEINGKRATELLSLPATGAWTTWKTATFSNVIVPAGTVKIKLVFEKRDFNLNYFRFTNAKDSAEVDLLLFSAETDQVQNKILLNFNKEITQVSHSSFKVHVNNTEVEVLSTSVNPLNRQQVVLSVNRQILKPNAVQLSYSGGDCKSGEKVLDAFSGLQVTNHTVQHYVVPGKVEAEAYFNKEGFRFESCSDIGGGQNAGYTAAGNYLDYLVYTTTAGQYTLDLRVAVDANTAALEIYRIGEEDTLLKTVSLSNTGGWQNWNTVSSSIPLIQGKNVLRIKAVTEGFNFNWFEIKAGGLGIDEPGATGREVLVYPVPASGFVYVESQSGFPVHEITITDITGKIGLKTIPSQTAIQQVDVSPLQNGVYFLQAATGKGIISQKIIIRK
ncbi:MAG: carbohydrate-binding protein [Candidatus Azobacteroides sp.]|nr:carbohydrate-binding protein [Candidatus Azobacteroides sp.]